MHEFGRLVLNRNPENYHRDVEQAAFSPGSMVPGIEDSPDPLLQFRMFFYRDAQYHRVGVNLHQIPVNCPFMAGNYSSLNFDGQLRVDANHAGNKQYTPNSFSNKFRPDTAEAPYAVSDNIVSRKSHYTHEGKQSEYAQATELYKRVMSEEAREHTHQNTAKMMRHVKEPIIQVIQRRPLPMLTKAAKVQFRRSTWHRSTISLPSTPKPCMIFCQRSTSNFPKLRRCQRTLTNSTKSQSSLRVRMIAWSGTRHQQASIICSSDGFLELLAHDRVSMAFGLHDYDLPAVTTTCVGGYLHQDGLLFAQDILRISCVASNTPQCSFSLPHALTESILC